MATNDLLTPDLLTLGLAQIAPVWFKREATLAKVLDAISDAAKQDCGLVGFGEALIPGYPKWLERSGGAKFDDSIQKSFHAEYLAQAVQIENGDLEPVCRLAGQTSTAVVLGIIERPADRGGHSLYASAVYIDQRGAIGSVHRKLMPTHDERLSWSPGDGHGLRVHQLGGFTVAALNCWENWMPLPRAALYAQGEDLHFALWPGSRRNTVDITRFIAREGRSYVASVSNLLRASDIPADTLHRDQFVRAEDEILSDGGSCLCGPDGEWIIEPIGAKEVLQVATIDHARVREERQNFDPAGHYARPDVTSLVVNRERQTTVRFDHDETLE